MCSQRSDQLAERNRCCCWKNHRDPTSLHDCQTDIIRRQKRHKAFWVWTAKWRGQTLARGLFALRAGRPVDSAVGALKNCGCAPGLVRCVLKCGIERRRILAINHNTDSRTKIITPDREP